MTTSTDADAARAAGIPEPTIRTWRNKADVARAVEMLTDDTLTAVMDMRRALMGKALAVMAEALDSKDERVRIAAAIDTFDRAEGKAVQKVAPVMPNGVDPYQMGGGTSTAELDDRMLARLEELARVARERRIATTPTATATAVTQGVTITTLPIVATPAPSPDTASEQNEAE